MHLNSVTISTCGSFLTSAIVSSSPGTPSDISSGISIAFIFTSAVIERPRQGGTIEPLQETHDRILVFRMELAAEKEHAKDWHQGQGNGCRADHGKGLGKSQRMKELSLLPGKRKHRHKRENDDRHREKRRTAYQ